MVASNAFIITEMEEKAEKRGEEKGEKRGEQKGEKIGVEKEVKKRIEEVNVMVKAMLLNKEPMEKIKQYSNLSQEEIEKIESSYKLA